MLLRPPRNITVEWDIILYIEGKCCNSFFLPGLELGEVKGFNLYLPGWHSSFTPNLISSLNLTYHDHSTCYWAPHINYCIFTFFLNRSLNITKGKKIAIICFIVFNKCEAGLLNCIWRLSLRGSISLLCTRLWITVKLWMWSKYNTFHVTWNKCSHMMLI